MSLILIRMGKCWQHPSSASASNLDDFDDTTIVEEDEEDILDEEDEDGDDEEGRGSRARSKKISRDQVLLESNCIGRAFRKYISIKKPKGYCSIFSNCLERLFVAKYSAFKVVCYCKIN